jgi:thiol-disulfide isomerase/thioredoxin
MQLLFKKTRLLSLLMLLFSLKLVSQTPIEYAIKLQKEKGKSPLGAGIYENTRLKSNMYGYKGMPTDVDTGALSLIVLDFKQRLYENLQSGTMTQEAFQQALKDDTTHIYKGDIKYKVGVFSGLKGKDKIVIVDSNNDLNFADEQVYRFDTTTFFINRSNRLASRFPDRVLNPKITEKLPILDIQYESYDGTKIIKQSKSIKIEIFDSDYKYPDEVQKALAIYTIPNDYLKGELKVKNTDYQTQISSKLRVMPGDHDEFLINKTGKYDKNAIYRMGDKMLLDGNVFQLDRFSPNRDSLILTYHGEADYIVGPKLNMKAPDFCKNSLDNEPVCLKDMPEKYILIDFWGTWCTPCIKAIPDLKKVRKKYKTENLEIISLAYDTDIEKVKSYVKENNMDWTHVFQKRTEQSKDNLTSLFDVSSYPTLILVDSKGFIVERGSGTDYIKKIDTFLKSKIKNK